MNIEKLAFKNYFELKEIQKVDLLLIIEFLQKDRKQWINQYTQAHNDYIVLQQENQSLKAQIDLLEDNRKYLNNKIDKAVKYMKKNMSYVSIECMERALYESDVKKILEILKGGGINVR